VKFVNVWYLFNRKFSEITIQTSGHKREPQSTLGLSMLQSWKR